MPRDLSQNVNKLFDVVVIGGGSNGTAIARDAAMRGLHVALVEKDDFGYGTVSRSTRLIHGGLRYLELFDFGLVRESLREREILLRTAPHLVHPLAFFTPVYEHSPVSLFKLRIGMWLYDLLSYDKSMPNHKFLRTDEAKAAEPLLNDNRLLGAFVYYDGHVPMPERLCLEAAQQASRRGALIVNHARATRLDRKGDTYTVHIRDALTDKHYELQARSVVNATGPWGDEVNDELLGKVAGQNRLRRTKGIHLLAPKLSERAVVMLAEKDGRLFFAIPWGEYTYIGTTDTDFDGNLDTVAANDDEIRYLVEETKRVFPEANLDEIHFTTAGVRPLVRDPKARHEGQVSRKHLIFHHADEGLRGYFSVLGGKITNMRSVAEETVDAVIRCLDVMADACTTRHTLFPGAMHPDMDRLKEQLRQRHGAGALSAATIDNLVDLYGSQAPSVLEIAEKDPSLAQPISQDGPDIWAQLFYGMEHEWVYTTADFLLRRTAIGLKPGMALDVAPAIARRLGEALGRSEEDIAADVASYETTVERMHGAVNPLHEALAKSQ